MKDKLMSLVQLLAKRHYSTNIIGRCILLPMQTNQMEEVIDKQIQATQQTKTEKELLEEIHKLEEQYMNNQ